MIGRLRRTGLINRLLAVIVARIVRVCRGVSGGMVGSVVEVFVNRPRRAAEQQRDGQK